jgi:hypothetical protein
MTPHRANENEGLDIHPVYRMTEIELVDAFILSICS